MFESMDTPHMIYYGALAVLGFAVLVSVGKALALGRGNRALDAVDTVAVSCASCGWEGEVPRLRKRCPMCGDNNFTT